MEHELRMGLSVWAVAAIVCNSLVGILILILFVILYKACKVPSHPEKVPVITAEPDQKKPEQKYLLNENRSGFKTETKISLCGSSGGQTLQEGCRIVKERPSSEI